jgi:hypothetical protein
MLSLMTGLLLSQLRHSPQTRHSPQRFGYDGNQECGYLTTPSLAHFYQFMAALRIPAPKAHCAATQDPDLFTYEQAIPDTEHLEEWLAKAIDDEVQVLEKMGARVKVSKSEVMSKILPGVWVLRIKRAPDRCIKQYKACYCICGDLQEGECKTFAPVVAWTTIQLLLVLTLTLDWYTCSVNFSSAFVQAALDDLIWIHLGCATAFDRFSAQTLAFA